MNRWPAPAPQRQDVRERAGEPPSPGVAPPLPALRGLRSPADLLALQRGAGNQAVTRMLRNTGGGPGRAAPISGTAGLSGARRIDRYFTHGGNPPRRLSQPALERLMESWRGKPHFAPFADTANSADPVAFAAWFEENCGKLREEDAAQILAIVREDTGLPANDAAQQPGSTQPSSSAQNTNALPTGTEPVAAGATRLAQLRSGHEADRTAVLQKVVGDVPTARVALLSMVNQSESAFLHEYLKIEQQTLSAQSTRNFIKVGNTYRTSRRTQAEVSKRFGQFAAEKKGAYQGGVVVINAHYSQGPDSEELLAGGLTAPALAALLTLDRDAAGKSTFAPRRIALLACAAEHYAHDLVRALRDAGVEVDKMEVVYVGGSMKFQPWPNPKFNANTAPEMLYSGPEVEKEEEFGRLQGPIAGVFQTRTGQEMLAEDAAFPDPDALQAQQEEEMAARVALTPVASLSEQIKSEAQVKWLQETGATAADSAHGKRYFQELEKRLTEALTPEQLADKELLKKAILRIRKAVLEATRDPTV